MKKYYHTLSKEKKQKIKNIYQKEYGKSDLKVCLIRLNIYAIIGYLSAMIILLYSFKMEESRIGSIIIAITLIIVSTIFLVGSIIVKQNVLNKIALKNK